MTTWAMRKVPFKFQLSDWTLFSVALPLQCRSMPLLENSTTDLDALDHERQPESEGFLLRALPIDEPLAPITKSGRYLRYSALQYEHCFIDLRLGFERYQEKFSSKTRSTIKRKIRKYAEHCGGEISWKSYRDPAQIRDFFRHAREVSALSYQERLLDSGLPDSEEYIREAEARAAAGTVRAYILFDRDRPVSYLYCPIENDIVIYAYLGYDPDYMKHSVGTVLQWLALETLFEEGCFKAFDFTEGESDHKRLFSTHQTLRANVFVIRASLINAAVIRSHFMMNLFSSWLGHRLDALGLKARIKRLIRFG